MPSQTASRKRASSRVRPESNPLVTCREMAREAWVCPKCGRSLTIRNQEHVCGHYDLEAHFQNRDPVGRAAFDWMCDIFESLGPYDLIPMKTTIAFAHGVNLAFVTTRRKGADLSVVLSRPPNSPRVIGSIAYSKSKTIYRIRVTDLEELDNELKSWLEESYSSSHR